jgi:hypothetical protein
MDGPKDSAACPLVVRGGILENAGTETDGNKGGREDDAIHRNPEDIEGAFVVEAAEVKGETVTEPTCVNDRCGAIQLR